MDGSREVLAKRTAACSARRRPGASGVPTGIGMMRNDSLLVIEAGFEGGRMLITMIARTRGLLPDCCGKTSLRVHSATARQLVRQGEEKARIPV